MHIHVQSNYVNSMSLGLEVLFQIISSSNYREVGINIYTPPSTTQNIIVISGFFYL